MNNIFVDSSFWVALSDPKENNYNQSVRIFKDIKQAKSQMVTTNFVFDETFTLIRKRLGISRALEFRDTIAKYGRQLQLERVSVSDEENSWKWFVRDIEKLSYTDCTSFAVMNRLGIKKVATFDEDFVKVGFELV